MKGKTCFHLRTRRRDRKSSSGEIGTYQGIRESIGILYYWKYRGMTENFRKTLQGFRWRTFPYVPGAMRKTHRRRSSRRVAM